MSEIDLANRVIETAYEDAESEVDNYNRQSARNFLMGRTYYWRKSLEIWCDMSGRNIKAIMKYARARYGRSTTCPF